MKLNRPAVEWFIFGAALALRAGWVLYGSIEAGPARELFPDERLHWQLATNLVERGELVTDDGRRAARMPAYPLFLSLFAWMGQSGILVARLAQALLGAATALMAYHLARQALGTWPGLVAGLLVCCDPYAVFFANLLLTEVLFIFFAVGLTACVWLVAIRTDRVRWPALMGVALLGPGALLTRPSAAGWILALWIMLWLVDRDRRRATRRLLAYAGVLVLLMLPWGLRNRAVLGSFAWLSTNGGVTLYDAQGPQANGSSNQAFLDDMPELAGLDEVERDRALCRLAVQQMRKDPARVVRLAWVKFCRTWNPVPNVAEYGRGYTALVSAVFMAVVLALAAIGLWRTFATEPRALARATVHPPDERRSLLLFHLLFWLPVIYFTLVHCVYIGSLRYRVPLMPLLELAAAAALWRRVASVPSEKHDS